MALRISNIDDIKYCREELEKDRRRYDEVINKLINTIKMSAVYWQGEEGDQFREELYSLIMNELRVISKEINAESNYLRKVIIVLENARNQIKSRLNG